MMTAAHPQPPSSRAFSLVEMLVVLAVVGILTAIAIVPFTAVTKERADQARDRQNAQNLVSMAQSGNAAGLDFIVDGDLMATIDNIVSGGTSSDGVFSGTSFSLEGLGDEHKLRASVYMELRDGVLLYKPDL